MFSGYDCLKYILINVTAKEGYTSLIRVPCGQCENCRARHARLWGLRLQMESRYFDNILHVTLTYDNDNIPYQETVMDDGTIFVNSTLMRYDITRFVKNFRRKLSYYEKEYLLDSTSDVKYDYDNHSFVVADSRPHLRYYAVGEYGTRRGRPHYHIIMFGLPLTGLTFTYLRDSWQKGIVDARYINPHSCGYVAGYVEKKLYYNRDYTRLPEFSQMSKGIGYHWLMDNIDYVDPQKFTVPVNGYEYGIGRTLSKIYRDYKGIPDPALWTIEVNQALERKEFFNWLDCNNISFDDYMKNRDKLAKHRNAQKIAKRLDNG